MPVEPLAVWTQTKARFETFRRLMDGSVNHKPVESFCHRRVGNRLELARMTLIGPPSIPLARTAIGGESFGGTDVLAIDMGH